MSANKELEGVVKIFKSLLNPLMTLPKDSVKWSSLMNSVNKGMLRGYSKSSTLAMITGSPQLSKEKFYEKMKESSFQKALNQAVMIPDYKLVERYDTFLSVIDDYNLWAQNGSPEIPPQITMGSVPKYPKQNVLEVLKHHQKGAPSSSATSKPESGGASATAHAKLSESVVIDGKDGKGPEKFSELFKDGTDVSQLKSVTFELPSDKAAYTEEVKRLYAVTSAFFVTPMLALEHHHPTINEVAKDKTFILTGFHEFFKAVQTHGKVFDGDTMIIRTGVSKEGDAKKRAVTTESLQKSFDNFIQKNLDANKDGVNLLSAINLLKGLYIPDFAKNKNMYPNFLFVL